MSGKSYGDASREEGNWLGKGKKRKMRQKNEVGERERDGLGLVVYGSGGK